MELVHTHPKHSRSSLIFLRVTKGCCIPGKEPGTMKDRLNIPEITWGFRVFCLDMFISQGWNPGLQTHF